jgi:replicative superfamily II helicase
MTKKGKTIEERVEELLKENPDARHERTMRLLAERIAYHEAKLSEEQRREDDSASG